MSPLRATHIIACFPNYTKVIVAVFYRARVFLSLNYIFVCFIRLVIKLYGIRIIMLCRMKRNCDIILIMFRLAVMSLAYYDVFLHEWYQILTLSEQNRGQHVLNKADYLLRLSACVHMCAGAGDVGGADRTCALSLIHGQTSTNTQVL